MILCLGVSGWITQITPDDKRGRVGRTKKKKERERNLSSKKVEHKTHIIVTVSVDRWERRGIYAPDQISHFLKKR